MPAKTMHNQLVYLGLAQKRRHNHLREGLIFFVKLQLSLCFCCISLVSFELSGKKRKLRMEIIPITANKYVSAREYKMPVEI